MLNKSLNEPNATTTTATAISTTATAAIASTTTESDPPADFEFVECGNITDLHSYNNDSHVKQELAGSSPFKHEVKTEISSLQY